MKGFICAMIILVFMFTGAFIYVHSIDVMISNLEEQIKNIEIHVKNEDWSECQTEIEKALDNWNHMQIVFKAFLDHQELDDIHLILSEIQGYADFSDKENILVKLDALKVLIHHIPENEKLTLENILDTKTYRIS